MKYPIGAEYHTFMDRGNGDLDLDEPVHIEILEYKSDRYTVRWIYDWEYGRDDYNDYYSEERLTETIKELMDDDPNLRIVIPNALPEELFTI